MERKANFLALIKRALKLLCAAQLMMATMANAQSWQLIHQAKLDYIPNQTSIDKKGQLYISDNGGSIYKYGQDGKLIHLYSTKQLGKIYLLEALHGLRVFAFYQDLQEILITDRFLANERTFKLDPLEYIRLSALSQDLNIWILLERDLTLQKSRSSDNHKLIENQWANEYAGENLNISFMKEFKNRLYLYDEGNQIFVFDNLGNFMTTIQAAQSKGIAFNSENMIVVYPNSITEIDINTFEQKNTQLPITCDKIQTAGNLYYLLFENNLSIYVYSPL